MLTKATYWITVKQNRIILTVKVSVTWKLLSATSTGLPANTPFILTEVIPQALLIKGLTVYSFASLLQSINLLSIKEKLNPYQINFLLNRDASYSRLNYFRLFKSFISLSRSAVMF